MSLHGYFIKTWSKIITVDFQDQRASGIGFAHQQQPPSPFGSPIRRINILGAGNLAEQRATEQYWTPARNDRPIQIFDQVGQILTTFIAKGTSRQAIGLWRQHADF